MATKYPQKTKTAQTAQAVSPAQAGPPLIVEPRCNVCTSPHRHAIDQMLVGAYTYSEIARQFDFEGIDRRSISSHHKKHLSYEEAAIRAVIEREAILARRNHEEGVERMVTKQTYLEVALHKAYDQLNADKVDITAGEAVKLIEMLARLEQEHNDVAIDEMRVQFNAFMRAVKTTVPADMWEHVREETHNLLKASGRVSPFAEAAKEIEEAVEIVDAEVATP